MKKKIIAIIMAIFTTVSVVGISGCGLLDVIDSEINEILGTDSETSETRPPNSSTGSTSDNSSTPSDSADQDEELPELISPENEEDFITNNITRIGGASLNAVSENAPVLRFAYSFEIPAYNLVLYNSATLNIICAPLAYFEEVNPNGYTYIDWAQAFENTDFVVTKITFDNSNITEFYGETLSAGFESISYEDIHTCFASVAYLDFQGSRTYNAFPDGETYRSTARSVAYMASRALNGAALGDGTHTNEEIAGYRTLINNSVDQMNGLTEPTADGSTYTLDMSTEARTVSVGGKINLNARTSPYNKDIAINYVSADETIATVDKNGNITGIKAGTTSVTVYVCGVPKTVTVRVL